MTVRLGRAVVAAALGILCLAVTRAPRPSRAQVGRLLLVALGVVVGFPICSSLALRDTTSAHGAVLIGLLPAATAVAAVVRGGERPSWRFWAACGFGMATVLTFAVVQGAGDIRVISWALLIALPVVLPITVIGLINGPPVAPDPAAWLGLGYLSVVSMFARFFAWYRGLATGGVARIAQLQLAQPVLTLMWSALLLSEYIGPATAGAALLVIVAVALTQRTRG